MKTEKLLKSWDTRVAKEKEISDKMGKEIVKSWEKAIKAVEEFCKESKKLIREYGHKD